jgi:hypothetical protein
MKIGLFSRIHTRVGALINTAALARCKEELLPGELFQQFVSLDEQPLKRLVGRSSRAHWAKAPVLKIMGVPDYEISGLGGPTATWSTLNPQPSTGGPTARWSTPNLTKCPNWKK